MLGQPVAYDEIPYFFSDQYDVGMEYSGYATEWDEVVFRGDVDGREFVAFWLATAASRPGMNVNVWDVNDRFETWCVRGSRSEPAVLADPETPLNQVSREAAR